MQGRKNGTAFAAKRQPERGRHSSEIPSDKKLPARFVIKSRTDCLPERAISQGSIPSCVQIRQAAACVQASFPGILLVHFPVLLKIDMMLLVILSENKIRERVALNDNRNPRSTDTKGLLKIRIPAVKNIADTGSCRFINADEKIVPADMKRARVTDEVHPVRNPKKREREIQVNA